MNMAFHILVIIFQHLTIVGINSQLYKNLSWVFWYIYIKKKKKTCQGSLCLGFMRLRRVIPDSDIKEGQIFQFPVFFFFFLLLSFSLILNAAFCSVYKKLMFAILKVNSLWWRWWQGCNYCCHVVHLYALSAHHTTVVGYYHFTFLFQNNFRNNWHILIKMWRHLSPVILWTQLIFIHNSWVSGRLTKICVLVHLMKTVLYIK